jgi:integrative and conjugative element protein (TIGR02256 family)
VTTLSISRAALVQAGRYGRAALPRETGGVLLGHFQSGEPVVTIAAEVPDPRATRIRYRRDATSAAATLHNHLTTDHNGLVGYLGEWHTHPLPLGPSTTDRRAMCALAADGEHAIALLVLALGAKGWRMHALQAAADGSVAPITIRTIEEPS